MDSEVWSALLGVVVMLVTSLLKQPHWSRQVKTAIFYAVSILAAVGQFLFVEPRTPGDIFESAAIIIAIANGIYNLYFKFTLPNQKLENVGVPRNPSDVP